MREGRKEDRFTMQGSMIYSCMCVCVCGIGLGKRVKLGSGLW